MIRFGTDGIRGRAGQHPVTAEVALAVGRAAAWFAHEHGGRAVVVGRDPRPSGPLLERSVVSGVCGEGAEARVAGVLPTSAVATALREGLGDVGVMITASHNPEPDNGFKVLAPGGRKLTDEEILRLEEWLDAPSQHTASPGSETDIGGEAWDAYTRSLAQAIGDVRALVGARLAVDLANGAAIRTATWLRRHVPAQFVFLADGDGPINENCGAVHPERLARAVVERGCHAGFAVDGDADRCVLVDELGQVVPGDGLAWLLTVGLGVRSLAVTVMSNGGLEPSLPGVEVIRTPVGDRHLQEAISSRGAQLGCEESGHVLFAGGLPTGDGVVTGLRAIAIAFSGATSLSGAQSGFHPFPRQITKVRVQGCPPLEEVELLQVSRRAGEAALGSGGRVFLRYSGTEPLLRILVEGSDEATVARVSTEVTSVAREALP
ncbi:MAG: phosphoglucosamine mutase [Deltaproteobacteria bacterium]|nr:phosphoglucosamine mutase [Deltaproteobacteria bacterium]